MWEDIASHLLILIFVSTYDSFFASIYEHIMTHFLFCQSSFLVIFLILRTLNNDSKTKFFSICMNNRKRLYGSFHSNNPTQNTSWHTSITADTQNPARNAHLYFILRLAMNGSSTPIGISNTQLNKFSTNKYRSCRTITSHQDQNGISS